MLLQGRKMWLEYAKQARTQKRACLGDMEKLREKVNADGDSAGQ